MSTDFSKKKKKLKSEISLTSPPPPSGSHSNSFGRTARQTDTTDMHKAKTRIATGPERVLQQMKVLA
jgi:hypothetical protein